MPPRKIIHDMRLAELSGVDDPAQKGADVVLMKSASGDKMTTTVNGHVHLIYDPTHRPWLHHDRNSGESSWSVAEGEEHGHSHPWVRLPDGTIKIGEAAGHTHEIDDGTAQVGKFADYLASEIAKADGGQGTVIKSIAEAAGAKVAEVCKVVHGAEPAGNIITGIQKALGISRDQLSKAGENAVMSDHDKTIETLKADLAKATGDIETLKADLAKSDALAKMSDDEKAHMKGMSEDEKKEFMAMDSDKRKAKMAAAASKADSENPVVYKSDRTGREYRKNDDPHVIELAKDADTQAAQSAAAAKAVEKADIEKSATNDLAGFSKDAAVSILSAIRKADLPDAERTGAMDALKGASAALESLTKANGHGESVTVVVPGGAPITKKSDAMQKRDAKIAEIQKRDGCNKSTAMERLIAEAPELARAS